MYTTNNLLKKTISINCDNLFILIIIDKIKKETSCSKNELNNNSLKNVHLTNATWRTWMYRFCSIYKSFGIDFRVIYQTLFEKD